MTMKKRRKMVLKYVLELEIGINLNAYSIISKDKMKIKSC